LFRQHHHNATQAAHPELTNNQICKCLKSLLELIKLTGCSIFDRYRLAQRTTGGQGLLALPGS